MNIEEIHAFLHERDLTMTRYDREGWDRFVKAIKLTLAVPSIHITGSNGKGSTAHYLEEIYRAQGYHVAAYSSPYFYRLNEMIALDGETISDADVVRLFALHESDFAKYDLSAFEIETYLAFAYFNEKKPDLAIIEVGMGGELDATNIFVPILSIVTSVSLEHTMFLGRTVSEIARSKGGIIKKEIPVLVGKLEESADSTLRGIAQNKKAPYFVVDDYHHEHLVGERFHFDYRPFVDLVLSTQASYQIKNASLAIEATKILLAGFPVEEKALRKGLLASTLICRLEKRHNIILDGAHNPEAVEALIKTLPAVSLGKPIHVLFAAFKDKNIALELPMIGRDCASITLTTFDNPRARDAADYFLYEADYPFEADYRVALSELLAKFPEDAILVTGSLAFVSIVRRYIIEELRL